MNRKVPTVSISIDNKSYTVKEGLTILEAAQQNDIYIPTLCAHKELSPYGGCRMCIVEVEGFRNLPTACTTPVSDGMVIRTNTAQVNSVRTEILQLFLSEHTSSCLICDEAEQCRQYMGTIRKAGVTTGCRYCPNDGQCELQDVTEHLQIKEIKYPIYYRDLRVEKEDPFYDRDYNLCILCGRCIRMCQEIRIANVLAFNHRGRSTTIGPALGRTHLEAGCEFCGACVSVCPTGALSEKARKWEGKPDREEVTTCTFCGVGCQMRLLIKGDRVIGSLPTQDELVNHGQLCVKGRFCISEMVNGYRRLRNPYAIVEGNKADISWDDAIDTVAKKLAVCGPKDFAMLVSPNCTNEDLYVAQKFTRVVMGSHHVDTTARNFYGAGFNAYLNLMRRAAPLADVQKASVVLHIGLDTRFGRSVVGVELRRAISRGAKVIALNPRDHNLSLLADKWLQPQAGGELDMLRSLAALTKRKKPVTGTVDDEIAVVAGMLMEATEPVLLVGSELLQYEQATSMLETIEKIADNIGAGILPLPAQNNLFGSILMGAYPELLPGAVSSSSQKRAAEVKKTWGVAPPKVAPIWNSSKSDKELKVLYMIGEVPPDGDQPTAEYLISQNIYPPDLLFEANLVLPAAAFTESDGSFINGEGRIQRVRAAVPPPGQALPDWKILGMIARKMGFSGFEYTSATQIHKEIAGLVDGFASFNKPKRQPMPLGGDAELNLPAASRSGAHATDRKYPLLMTMTVTEHTHRGFPLSIWVEGTRPLFAEETVDINPEDAGKAGLTAGDEATVTSADFERTWPIRISKEQPPGTLHVALTRGELIGSNPYPVKIRRSHV